jgi:hypothetical protein
MSDCPEQAPFRARHRSALTPFQRLVNHVHSRCALILGKVVTHTHPVIASSRTVGARFIVKTGYLQVSAITGVTRYHRVSFPCSRSPSRWADAVIEAMSRYQSHIN